MVPFPFRHLRLSIIVNFGVHIFQPTSDCHLEDIRGEVFEAGFGGTYRLGIDVPIDLPDFRGNLIEESGIFHGATKLGLEDFGEGSDREIKIDP